MAFLATEKGSINERFIVKLVTKDGKVRVHYLNGDAVLVTIAELDDAKAFMDKVNAR